MAIKLAIIADDFTGANDTGVQFSKKGLKTLVISQLDRIKELDYQADVIVVDTDSRFDNPQEAYDKVFEVSKSLKDLGVKHIYNKLDSTLRGNIGSEIEAAMQAGDYEVAIVAPALPSNSRLTIGGIQLVHGVALEQTEIADDPVTPVNHSYIPDIIKEQTAKKVGVINLKDLLKDKAKLQDRLKKEIKAGSEVIVIDAVTEQDLDLIANTAVELEEECLWVGSAGLAEALPTNLDLVKPEVASQKEGGVVGIAGSVSDVTRQQVAYAEQDLDHLEIVDLKVDDLLQGRYEEELNRVLEQTNKLLVKGKNIIIRSAKNRELVAQAREIGQQNQLSNFEVSQRIAQFLGEVTRELYLAGQLKGLLLTGGDIAVKAASLIGANATVIEDEVLPGIPVGFFKGDNLPKVPVVTKAGAFGEQEAIVEIINFLARRNNNE
ncbi:four-carbon acid sugar kinase family protein [Natroniella sulfidigena]|uniref:four-carbon acid sugar kinase family protein n=1 Tax=Natroniella sulfidigena TaxID=723921 RepID=UPI00200B33A7|nr:four-carbon acid sugar kinase family protein [Natroniella sulfidigena]MCK8818035.1 four-carbon acid sugar kinase family protein [Natroniella sulfidigena]